MLIFQTMDRLSLNAEERLVLGKKVKKLRQDGILPGHVFGKGIETEHVSVNISEFLHTFSKTGETTLIDLKIGAEKVRPVLVRDVDHDPVTGKPIHVDFYQVNLTQKVKVSVPLVLIGEEPEIVKSGEAIVLQTLNEVEVEALPTDLVEKIEVDISTLKNIDDSITVGQLSFDREKLTVEVDAESIAVKLAPAVSAEMEELLEEQAAEAAAASAEATAAEETQVGEGGEKTEGEVATEGKTPAETGTEPAENATEQTGGETPKEE